MNCLLVYKERFMKKKFIKVALIAIYPMIFFAIYFIVKLSWSFWISVNNVLPYWIISSITASISASFTSYLLLVSGQNLFNTENQLQLTVLIVIGIMLAMLSTLSIHINKKTEISGTDWHILYK